MTQTSGSWSRLALLTTVGLRRVVCSFAAVVSALAISGCVYVPPVFDEHHGIEPASFEVGVTTRDEIVAMLGDPIVDEGHYVFDQLYQSAGGFLIAGGYTAGYLPLGETHMRLLFAFDDNGVLEALEVEQADIETPGSPSHPGPSAVSVNTRIGHLIPLDRNWLSDVVFFHAATFSPDGAFIVASDGDDTITIIDLAAESARTLQPDGFEVDGYVESISLSPDGRFAAIQSRTIRIVDLDTGRQTIVFEGHGNASIWETLGAGSMAWMPTGHMVLSGGTEGDLKLWDVTDGRDVSSWQAHDGSINALAVSPDGAVAASAGSDGMMRFWDIATGRELGSIERYGLPAYSSDGSLLAIASAGVVELRRLGAAGAAGGPGVLEGMAVMPFAGSMPSFYPYDLRFAPGAPRLLASLGTTVIWDWREGKRTPLGLPPGNLFLAFAPDGSAVATWGYEGVSLWELPGSPGS